MLLANCILSFNKLRNIYKILNDMKYALISGVSSGLAKEVIRTGHWEIVDKKED